MWNICKELLIWEKETGTNETPRIKILKQEIIHIGARGWKFPVKLSPRKKKKRNINFDVFDCFKGDSYFWMRV